MRRYIDLLEWLEKKEEGNENVNWVIIQEEAIAAFTETDHKCMAANENPHEHVIVQATGQIYPLENSQMDAANMMMPPQMMPHLTNMSSFAGYGMQQGLPGSQSFGNMQFAQQQQQQFDPNVYGAMAGQFSNMGIQPSQGQYQQQYNQQYQALVSLRGQVLGPESIVVEKNVLYTCTLDGKCLKIVNGQIEKSIPMTAHTNCDGKRQTIPFCGRPLGIRRYTDQQFIVADAVLGLMLINFDEETKELLVPSMTIVEKKRLGFPDDLDIAADNDTIFFSDLSAKYGYSDVHLAFLEHVNDGRLIEYKMSTGKLRVVMDGLVVANGVQMHPDKQSVLVCETAMARIHR
uniref:Str_synth domain-containing protein n=1 Tax=Globodera pallida TaxID=36090 RepID=A0A183CJ86_GLOPA